MGKKKEANTNNVGHRLAGSGEEKAAKKKKIEARDLWIRQFYAQLKEMLDDFKDGYDIEQNLTGTERRRLTSARVKNNGFIDKAFDVARDNPTFLPPNFDAYYLTYQMRDLEDLRQLRAVLDQFQRTVTDVFYIQANTCYGEALRVYNSLKEQKNAKVPGAASLFDMLEIYFKSRGNRPDTDAEPTQKQLERDAKKLISGKADGSILIKNESPRTQGGVHEVIDDVHKGRRAVKGSVEESVDEGKK